MHRSIPGSPIGAMLVAALVGLVFAGPPAWAQLAGEPAVLHERDFARNSALVARPHDVAVLELAPRRPGRPIRNLARYHLQAGTHTFCVDAGDEDEPRKF